MKTITLTPAYGRDYKSQEAALQDFGMNRDFIIADVSNRWCGKPVNRDQLPGHRVTIRYAGLKRVLVTEVPA